MISRTRFLSSLWSLLSKTSLLTVVSRNSPAGLFNLLRCHFPIVLGEVGLLHFVLHVEEALEDEPIQLIELGGDLAVLV